MRSSSDGTDDHLVSVDVAAGAGAVTVGDVPGLAAELPAGSRRVVPGMAAGLAARSLGREDPAVTTLVSRTIRTIFERLGNVQISASGVEVEVEGLTANRNRDKVGLVVLEYVSAKISAT